MTVADCAGIMGYVVTGFVVIVVFVAAAATLSTFLLYAIGEAATREDEVVFTPASYQPMEMLTRRGAPSPGTPDATSTANVPIAA